jgi:hypothetical protein
MFYLLRVSAHPGGPPGFELKGALKNFQKKPYFLQQTYNGPMIKPGGIEPSSIDLQRLKIQQTTSVRFPPAAYLNYKNWVRLAPAHPPLASAVSPPGTGDWVLTHPRSPSSRRSFMAGRRVW